jgi:hypothetical protein
MRLRLRLRIQTLMAVIALAFGITFELKNHAERDRILRRRADCYREAAIHFRRLWKCDGAVFVQPNHPCRAW